MHLRHSICAAALGLGLGAAGTAQAVEVVWSYSQASVAKSNYCGGPLGPCPNNLQQLSGERDMRFGDTSASASLADYASITGGANFGAAFASAEAGAPTGPGGLVLPQLHAYSDATLVAPPAATPGFGWNFALTEAVTGFRWSGEGGIDIPFDTFVANLDYSGSGPAGNGLLVAGFAITTDAIIGNDDVGRQWFGLGYGPSGGAPLDAFAATCATGGALAIADGATINPVGPGSLTLAAASCGGPSLHLDTGDEFYFWSKLFTFRASDGVTDAANTFTLAFNPVYADAPLQQQLVAGLQQIEAANISAAAPEPAAWAMLIAGFAAIGAAMRRRRSRHA